MFFSNRTSQLSNQGMYTLMKQIKEEDRQKHLLMSSEQRLSEEDRNQLLKEERCFKCHKFRHLIMNCMAKKQDVSNVTEKNDIKLVTKKKIRKEYRSSSVDDSDESEN